ncbi:hypothetical protein [Microvirga massiliensis]|uniref:hypothetical protein n=1 Tax=Microvirga massiliensis TaxID=1033741 RepID=UPI00062B8216|nr:hypothetical protein [Microvirga massiliensis]
MDAFHSAAARYRADNLAGCQDVLAHVALGVCGTGEYKIFDSFLLQANARCPNWHSTAQAWLLIAHQRASDTEAVSVPSRTTAVGKTEDPSLRPLLPQLFDTPISIETEFIPDAKLVYLDPRLAPTKAEDSSAEIIQALCRRRCTTNTASTSLEPRLVEVGVGRACLVDEVKLGGETTYYDYTVLGIGLTPFSEGGYVEIGRKIDGKASLVRALHRKAAAERLEQHGCRAGLVTAIFQLEDDGIEMPDGATSPAALIARAFRCAFRVKQLDPLICCMHSIQHTPLVFDYIERKAKAMKFGCDLNASRTLFDDEALAVALEQQMPSQEALRELLSHSGSYETHDWTSLIVRARQQAIDDYAPLLVDLAKSRLSAETQASSGTISDIEYIEWFAGIVGSQLATWRDLRFLHDYHHPGVSRWQPGHLYTLGENNVTLLAEFPDLDTGVFIDEDPAYLNLHLQLGRDDIRVLQNHYHLFHRRDVLAARTVVRTLTQVLFRGDDKMAQHTAKRFDQSYASA